MQTFRELREERYQLYKVEHPDVSFAEWLDLRMLEGIAKGVAHSSLGPRLLHCDNWWDAGANTFASYRSWLPIRAQSRVVDYGCGSLRIGGHFIRFLDPGHYFGLDVVSDFYEMGKQLVGADLLRERMPRLAVINEEAIVAATEFGADVVCSNAVSYHVHPDEAPLYFRNLARIASKPGATLFFDASVSDQPVADRQLSMPLDYFRQSLPNLEFVSFRKFKNEKQNGMGILEFRRPI